MMQSRLGTHVYLDTNLWIYAIEGVEPWGRLADTLVQLNETGVIQLVASELCLSEVLVAPIRNGSTTLIAKYKQVFAATPRRWIVPVDLQILIRAAELRASTRLRLPDAIHLATALDAGCTSFITNDVRHWPRELIPIFALEALGS